MKKRALISVSNKDNIVDFAKGLTDHNYEVISTGGTLRVLQEAGIAVKAVDEVTGFPEILDGRVKTLHPLIHRELLEKRDDETHQKQLQENKIHLIEVVDVNLYLFKDTLMKHGISEDEIIENIDIC